MDSTKARASAHELVPEEEAEVALERLPLAHRLGDQDRRVARLRVLRRHVHEEAAGRVAVRGVGSCARRHGARRGALPVHDWELPVLVISRRLADQWALGILGD